MQGLASDAPLSLIYMRGTHQLAIYIPSSDCHEHVCIQVWTHCGRTWITLQLCCVGPRPQAQELRQEL